MASPTQWTRVWVNSRSWWWTGRPGMLQFIGSQRVRHDWTELIHKMRIILVSMCINSQPPQNLQLTLISISYFSKFGLDWPQLGFYSHLAGADRLGWLSWDILALLQCISFLPRKLGQTVHWWWQKSKRQKRNIQALFFQIFICIKFALAYLGQGKWHGQTLSQCLKKLLKGVDSGMFQSGMYLPKIYAQRLWY